MKTIEERAAKYACDDGVMPDSPECESCFNIYGKCTRDAYIAGAKAEHKELTRWHDPKEELPKKHHRVLLKVRKNSYAFIEVGTLQATDDGVRFIFSDCNDCEVIGWREIHENE